MWSIVSPSALRRNCTAISAMMIQPMSGPNAASEIRPMSQEADHNAAQRRRQERPEYFPNDDTPVNDHGADIADDEQRQDEARRFPRMKNHGEE